MPIETVQLESPIKRGETEITTIELRRPLAGELRGVKLADVLQMDIDAITALLPRITQPPMIQQEIASMDPADFTALSIKVVSFFVQKQVLGTESLGE